MNLIDVARQTWVVEGATGLAIATGLWRRSERAAMLDRITVVRPRHQNSPFAMPRTRNKFARKFDDLLALAGLTISRNDALRLWLVSCLGAIMFGSAIDARVGVLFGFTVLSGGPVALISLRHHSARRANAQLPALVRRIASELRVGGTVTSGMSEIASEPVGQERVTRHDGVATSALVSDCVRIQRRLDLGATLEGSLRIWCVERPTDGVRAAAGALVLASQVGGPAADALDGLANSLAARLSAIEETRAQSAQARASALVMVLAPVGYLVFSSSIDQRSLDVLLGTVIGRGCLAVGLVLDGLAVLWIRYLLRDRYST